MKIPRLDLGLGDAHAQAVAEVLRSGMLVQGAQVETFEAALATRCQRTHAIAVSNGTSALELALRALDIGAGDEVLCPALSWPSPAHAVLNAGATLRLVDVDPDTWNASATAFAEARTSRTRAAIVIDQFGSPAEHQAIAQALTGVSIIEDAACALGSQYNERPCGSFGSIACLSFHPLKVLTTGEGGMCLTDDNDLAERLRALRNHGQSSPGVFVAASGNARLSEIHAALGNAHLTTLDARIARRLHIREKVAQTRGVKLQRVLDGCQTNAQTLGIQLDNVRSVEARARAMQALREREIGVGPLSYALTQIGSIAKDAQPACPHAEFIAQVGMAVPCDASMSDAQVAFLLDALAEVNDELKSDAGGPT